MPVPIRVRIGVRAACALVRARKTWLQDARLNADEQEIVRWVDETLEPALQREGGAS